MNFNAKPTGQEKLAYINNKVDMKDEKIAPIAKACLKTATELMKDIKAQNLTFTDTYTNDKGEKKQTKSAAVVKVTAATEKTMVEVNGRNVEATVPKQNSRGDDIYNANISIRKGAETLQLVCSQYLDGDKARITSMNWSEFNRANPSASPRAKGADEIAKSKASPELKAIADAIDKGGYIKDASGVSIDRNLDKSDTKAVELANAMRTTMGDVVKAMKEQNKLFEVTTKNAETGEEKTFNTFASVSVTPKKNEDGTPKLNDNGGQRYFVQASFIGNRESLVISGADRINEDGKVRLTNIKATDFTGGKEHIVHFSGNDAIQKSPMSADIKALAAAIDKSGFIEEYNSSELKSLAYSLNTETFKKKVVVEIEDEKGNKSDAERKLLNANYNEESEYTGKDGKTYTNPESITIFNKSDATVPFGDKSFSEKDIRIQFTISEQYGNTVQSVNSALTNILDEKGKPTGDVRFKNTPDEASLRIFVNSEADVVNFCPNLPELQEAIAEFKGLDLEKIKDIVENNVAEAEAEVEEVAPEDFDAVAPDDDIPYNPDDFEEIG